MKAICEKCYEPCNLEIDDKHGLAAIEFCPFSEGKKADWKRLEERTKQVVIGNKDMVDKLHDIEVILIREFEEELG